MSKFATTAAPPGQVKHSIDLNVFSIRPTLPPRLDDMRDPSPRDAHDRRHGRSSLAGSKATVSSPRRATASLPSRSSGLARVFCGGNRRRTVWQNRSCPVERLQEIQASAVEYYSALVNKFGQRWRMPQHSDRDARVLAVLERWVTID